MCIKGFRNFNNHRIFEILINEKDKVEFDNKSISCSVNLVIINKDKCLARAFDSKPVVIISRNKSICRFI